MFAQPTRAGPLADGSAGHDPGVPEIFMAIGVATAALLALARWWEERPIRKR